jgi:hypothetical protein
MADTPERKSTAYLHASTGENADLLSKHAPMTGSSYKDMLTQARGYQELGEKTEKEFVRKRSRNLLVSTSVSLSKVDSKGNEHVPKFLEGSFKMSEARSVGRWHARHVGARSGEALRPRSLGPAAVEHARGALRPRINSACRVEHPPPSQPRQPQPRPAARRLTGNRLYLMLAVVPFACFAEELELSSAQV